MITTADDFGYNHKVNIETIKLLNNSKIDRISLLVNFPGTEEAIKLYKENYLERKIPIGLHFNMVEGKNFDPLSIFLLKILFKKITKERIQQELESQIKVFKTFNLNLEHLDSHQNIHLFSPMNEVFYKIAKKYKIKHVRSKKSVIRRLKKFPLKFILFHVYYFLNKLAYSWNSYPKKMPSEFEEIIIHPGKNVD